MQFTQDAIERFWSKVDRASGLGPNGDCWFWTGSSRGVGYGAFKAGGKVYDAHRVAWFLANGTIPAGKLVCHLCDIRHCVNPSHLKLGSHRDNIVDACLRGRATPFKRARKQPLTDEQIAEIVDQYGRGVSERVLSRKFNVPPTSLKRVLKLAGAKQ